MPNPPATRSQQPVNSGKTCCPFAAQKPCDVQSLEVKVVFADRPAKGEEEGKETVRSIRIDGVKRKPNRALGSNGRPVAAKQYPKLGWNLNADLANYDFVIDAFADFPQPRGTTAATVRASLKELASGDGTKFAKDKARISATTEFNGLHCERQEHGLVIMKPLTGPGPTVTSKHVDQQLNKIAPDEYVAQYFPMLDAPWSDVSDGTMQGGAAAGAGFIFDFIGSVMAALNPKEVEVVALSCGKRPKEKPLPRNVSLRALVRIFRKDVWSIGLKIPPLGQFKRERAATRQLLTGAKEGSFSSSNKLGGNSSSHSGASTRSANGGSVTTSSREQWRGGDGSSHSSTSTNYGGVLDKKESRSQHSGSAGSEMSAFTQDGKRFGNINRTSVEERLRKASGFEVVVARNGVELPLSQTFEKIKSSIETFAKVIGNIQELFRKAPQVGWKVSFDLSVLAGTIVLECGPKLEALTADGRYWPINYVLEGSMKLELVNLRITLSFGLEAMALDTGLVLKVEGSVSLRVEISVDLHLDLIRNPVKEVGLQAASTNELKIVGYVSVLGKTVTGAELSVANGFELQHGKLLIDVTRPCFDLRGKLRAKETTVSGWIKVPWWWDKRVEKVKLLDGCDIHTFR